MSETKTTRPRSAVAATPHPQAAAAAVDALRRGGNAVDAACAATLTLCVVAPGSVGIGGYGGCMVAHLAGRGVVAIDFDSRAPAAYRDELFMPNPKVAHSGYLAVTVPGVVAGINLAVRECGKLTFRDAATHAQGLARDGFRMDGGLVTLLENWKKRADEASVRALFPGGTIPKVGEVWKQPHLAQVLQRLCDDGPTALYHGEIPRQIARQVHDHGGILSEEDFASYKPTLVDALKISYRGHELFTPPPPAGGLTTLQILKALEQFDVKAMEPFGTQYLHTLAEVTRACWRDRDQFLGDPETIEIPYADLLSEKRAADIARAITDRATPPAAKPDAAPDSEHTINVLTSDAAGNVCSLTATQGEMFGSAVVIEGLGLVMGHGMSRFTYVPGSPNAPAPGKRMHHNMSPLVVLRDGRPRFVIGMPGGQKIPNVTAQIAVNLIDFGRAPLDAIKSPRLHTTGVDPVSISARVPRPVVAELEAKGHAFKKAPSLGGPANAIAIDPETGVATAASEAGAKSVAEM
jgi:gamma-glutamyltranspeptidase/glutathione hydrolase